MKLLVSVRDAQETSDALAGGADWIDLKEPLRGPLGAVSPSIAKATLKTIGGCCRVSAALGELLNWEAGSELLTIPGIDVVKLGLARCGQLGNWQSQWTAAFERCAQFGKQLAAVIYADWQCAATPHPTEILGCAHRAGAQYLLVDTFDKQGLSSIAVLGRDSLEQLLPLAWERGMTTVLAGNLRVNDLTRVAGLPVDIVAIRGAACGGERTSKLDPDKVRHFSSRLTVACEAVQHLNSPLTTSD
jgi:uncharacterized protein (UPF0264 family)